MAVVPTLKVKLNECLNEAGKYWSRCSDSTHLRILWDSNEISVSYDSIVHYIMKYKILENNTELKIIKISRYHYKNQYIPEFPNLKRGGMVDTSVVMYDDKKIRQLKDTTIKLN